MNVEIVNRPDAQVLGISARINPMQADYNDLWSHRYDPHEAEIAALATEPGHYGVYYACGQPGMADFVAGRIVGAVAEVPEGLTLRPLPGGAYAAVSCALGSVGPTWQQIYGGWLPSSGYAEDESRPSFEYYAPGTVGPDDPVTIYLPVAAR